MGNTEVNNADQDITTFDNLELGLESTLSKKLERRRFIEKLEEEKKLRQDEELI